MNKSEKIFKVLQDNRLIALLSPTSEEQCLQAYRALNPLGITMEIAFRTEAALNGIKAVISEFPDALVIAGTVMTRRQAEQAVEAGVAGIVSADYISAVVECCVNNDIMCVPGGLSDVGKQLVQKAELYKCELDELHSRYPYQWMHKLFPAATAQQDFFGLAKAWKGPFKGLQLLYTGGVSLGNLADKVQLDPDGIFCGSALTKAIDEPEKMIEEAKKWISIIKNKK